MVRYEKCDELAAIPEIGWPGGTRYGLQVQQIHERKIKHKVDVLIDEWWYDQPDVKIMRLKEPRLIYYSTTNNTKETIADHIEVRIARRFHRRYWKSGRVDAYTRLPGQKAGS